MKFKFVNDKNILNETIVVNKDEKKDEYFLVCKEIFDFFFIVLSLKQDFKENIINLINDKKKVIFLKVKVFEEVLLDRK